MHLRFHSTKTIQPNLKIVRSVGSKMLQKTNLYVNESELQALWSYSKLINPQTFLETRPPQTKSTTFSTLSSPLSTSWRYGVFAGAWRTIVRSNRKQEWTLKKISSFCVNHDVGYVAGTTQTRCHIVRMYAVVQTFWASQKVHQNHLKWDRFFHFAPSRTALIRNLLEIQPLGYNPYCCSLWTYFAPIFRKIASQTFKSVGFLWFELRWKALILAHRMAGQTSKFDRMRPVSTRLKCRGWPKIEFEISKKVDKKTFHFVNSAFSNVMRSAPKSPTPTFGPSLDASGSELSSAGRIIALRQTCEAVAQYF